jgi:uncharacterized Ntn-hydrolase superfamily protein
MIQLNTFSIVAYDPQEGAWGVGVASKFLAAAAVVSWARAGAGAVATQALGKVSFGPDGLLMMQSGMSAEETLAKLISQDEDFEHRQVGIVDQQGRAAAHTGAECFSWAGNRIGQGYTCQGNILAGPGVLEAMSAAYEGARGELADRLVAALIAADGAGGDRRGKQSAGVLVVKANGGYGGDNDRYLDLRVDDDPNPCQKLVKMVELHHLYFGTVDPASLIPLDAALIQELQTMLAKINLYKGGISGVWDEASREAFWELCGTENLEERADVTYEGKAIDPVVLKYLRDHFGQ